MNGKAHNIWIDISDLVTWNGHFTGIQRVVYSYASRFATEGARFIIYDPIDDRYVEVVFSLLEQLKAQVNHPPLSKRQRVKHLIGGPYYALSPKQRESLRPFVRVANRMTRTVIHALVDKGKAKSPFRSFAAADFERGDLVVVIGAGWNTPGLLDRLCEIRANIGIRLVQHINDILPVYQPHLFADELPKLFNPYVEKAIGNTDIVTVISEATKRDVTIFCKERGITRPVIEVVRLGEDIQVVRPKRPPNFPLKGDFVLSVGTFEIRKNYLLLYQAAKLAQLEGRTFPDIVIVGKKGWLTDDLAHIIANDPYTQNKIYWISNISDEGLRWLYEKCMFTVFPSLCEGWGLPVVEALGQGKLCVASGVSSMLEIGGEMVDYFLPYDARACMDKILEYASGRYKASNRVIAKNYRTYTWDESYDQFKRAVGIQVSTAGDRGLLVDNNKVVEADIR